MLRAPRLLAALARPPQRPARAHGALSREPPSRALGARSGGGSRGSGGPGTAENGAVTPTPREAALFDFLLYIQHVYAPRTRLRVAGGWVRDKLRGAESADVDVVLDNMRGKKFAGLITKFQRQRKLPPSAVGVVKANADKSKHLEVATVTIEGLAVDLVHLRSDQYALDSRIPSTTFATPEEDAKRRDLTINALFYNLHTREVEDFTGRGLADLEDGVVRTPLEPLQTFMDDPLRVFRAVRFACEFGYSLDPELVTAVLEHEEIKDAIRQKVSRERIGIEVRKMLSGNDPARALQLLTEFGLLEIVFNDPQADESSQHPPREWTQAIAERALSSLRYLQESRLALASHQISFVEASGAILAAMFLTSTPPIESPLANVQPISQVAATIDDDALIDCAIKYVTKREAITYALPLDEMVEMLKTNVKWPKPAAKRAALIVEAVATFPTTDDVTDEAALAVARFIWMPRYHSVMAPAVAILSSRSPSSEGADYPIQKQLLDLASQYSSGSEDASSKRRRVDGRVVKEKLGMEKPGPEIARALSVLQVWEVLHPNQDVAAELSFLEKLAPRL